MIEITFFGVRGSTPCSSPSTSGVGGNTSCVSMQVDDEPIILCDLGTGLRYLGCELEAELAESGASFEGTALVTHLHWDHVQGLPFFRPLLQPGAAMRIFGPVQEDGQTLADEVGSFVRPPLFPVCIGELPGAIEFREVTDESFAVGSATVTAASVAHCGPTNGYRIDTDGASVVYIPDHQEPAQRKSDGSVEVPASVIELCRNADVLIHDSQYDEAEFAAHLTWGHSTYRYAAEVARQSGVAKLVLFHHDPTHDDGWIANAVVAAQAVAGPDVEVVAAIEGLVINVGSSVPVSSA